MNETPPRIRRDVSNLPRPSTRIEAYSHNAPGEHSPTGWMKVRLDRQIARPPCRLPTLPIAQSILLRNPPLPFAHATLSSACAASSPCACRPPLRVPPFPLRNPSPVTTLCVPTSPITHGSSPNTPTLTEAMEPKQQEQAQKPGMRQPDTTSRGLAMPHSP